MFSISTIFLFCSKSFSLSINIDIEFSSNISIFLNPEILISLFDTLKSFSSIPIEIERVPFDSSKAIIFIFDILIPFSSLLIIFEIASSTVNSLVSL
ncbi:Uncharacterised protein [Metamycoplasma alkalescens]|uniref:Uncharacterized protein n=1 Tax=Metamycoplasma alkalescens TaxID=45363 RepID=A0A3B0P6B7_9BACT|nr:Uncharacterised protein [Metamycoplasma alkalescens]